MGGRRTSSLRRRLALAFAGIALLAAVVIGAVIVPLLAGHYATAEQTYLEAAAERAVRDLAAVDWTDAAALRTTVVRLTAITQSRVTVTDPAGRVLVELGPPAEVLAPPEPQPLPNPLGIGLLGGTPDPVRLSRSSQEISRPIVAADGVGGGHLGSVRLSSPPAYEQVALWAVVEAWLLASLVGVAAAAVGGLVAARSLTRPLLALTSASDRMAGGDLAARAPVDRDDELGRLAVSFNAMAGRNEETVGTLRRFVADAAHEIGTPLTALQADLELAEAGATPDQRRLLDRAMGQAERLGALSSGLLRLARIEAGDGPLRRDPVDVAALAAVAADAAASRVDQAELTLAVDAPGAPVLVLGDADRLRTAVGYLLDNAVKFTPAGGAIRLSVRVEDRWAILLVDDTGIGIPADDLDGLFERFRRGRNAFAYPGSGLGLAIVRATAVGHGGAVRAERLEPGTRVELRLPLA